MLVLVRWLAAQRDIFDACPQNRRAGYAPVCLLHSPYIATLAYLIVTCLQMNITELDCSHDFRNVTFLTNNKKQIHIDTKRSAII